MMRLLKNSPTILLRESRIPSRHVHPSMHRLPNAGERRNDVGVGFLGTA